MPLHGVTLAGFAKKYPKNGGVRKANFSAFKMKTDHIDETNKPKECY